MKGTKEMTSNFLNQIGLGNIDIAYIMIALLASIIILFVMIIISMLKIAKESYGVLNATEDVKSIVNYLTDDVIDTIKARVL